MRKTRREKGWWTYIVPSEHKSGQDVTFITATHNQGLQCGSYAEHYNLIHSVRYKSVCFFTLLPLVKVLHLVDLSMGLFGPTSEYADLNTATRALTMHHIGI